LAKRTPCSTALAARSDPSVATRMFLNNIVLLLVAASFSREDYRKSRFGRRSKRLYRIIPPGIPVIAISSSTRFGEQAGEGSLADG
jgi:hypothetical protein